MKTAKYIRLLKKAKNNKDIKEIIDKIYIDGFEDGIDSIC